MPEDVQTSVRANILPLFYAYNVVNPFHAGSIIK